MSSQSKVEPDPLAVLEEVSKRLKIDDIDHLDLALLDAFSFKSAKPKKWPSWADLDTDCEKQGNPSNRNKVIRAVLDLCAKVEMMLDRPALTTALGADEIHLHHMKVSSVRKKIALLEDALTPPNPWPLFAALEETDKRLLSIDPHNPDLSILDSFAFQPGKPGLFTTWADLDMTIKTTNVPANRSCVIAALKDLVAKAEQMLHRPACQRTVDSSVIEKHKAFLISITEKVALLGDILSSPHPQPMLTMLEEVNRRLDHSTTSDHSVLDSFAFRPGKPGLFTVWSDLDMTEVAQADPNNRGAAIMALRDLLTTFDRMLDRPSFQKSLEPTALEHYRSMRIAIGQKLDQFSHSISPSVAPSFPNPRPSAPTAPSLIVEQKPSVISQPPQDHERIVDIKRKIGDSPSIWKPILFSRTAWAEAGAMAGIAMIVALLVAIPFPYLIIAVPIVGKMALAFSFVQRKKRVNATIKRCQEAEGLYNSASTSKDILDIFSFLTTYAQAQFLVWLGSEFRELVGNRYAGIKPMCLQINSFLATPAESLERTHARATFPKEGLGEDVFNALLEKEKGDVC